jgi:eukaryotic-like serine/threonine-protein kinase
LGHHVPQICTDPTDDLPVWEFEPGEPITPEHLAWEPLGVGQRCETWLAWSTQLWAPVVVKLARPHQAEHPRARVAVTRECEALIRCPYPALPRLLADGRAGTPPYLVQEYLDGPTLSAAIVDAPLAADETVAVAAQLTAVIRTLHRAGLAHVDLKADNVILRDGRPCLLDLGSARELGRMQPAGRPIGSPGYAAPELEAGDPISAAMDLYGIGTIMYEALSGEPAFDPDLAASDRPDPDSLGLPGEVPDGLAGLTRLLLSVDPARRPGSADELLARLAESFAPTSGAELWPDAAQLHLMAALPAAVSDRRVAASSAPTAAGEAATW